MSTLSEKKENESINNINAVNIIGEGTIVIRLNQCCRDDIIKELEKNLGDKFGRKVILLDAKYGEILTLPPEKVPQGVHGRP